MFALTTETRPARRTTWALRWMQLLDARRQRRHLTDLRRDPRLARDIGMTPLPVAPARNSSTLLW
ncbi:hypothetical protein [Marinovum sp.]|uniref:hypothetical protein n=1 Tax=Marinovum sp. TaxID=2024839 RepID=UPI002B271E2C|nr:hypothetical protein [Marinovum sp.]